MVIFSREKGRMTHALASMKPKAMVRETPIKTDMNKTLTRHLQELFGLRTITPVLVESSIYVKTMLKGF